MEEGIDEIDDLVEDYTPDNTLNDNQDVTNDQLEDSPSDAIDQSNDPFIVELLKSRGITDLTKIKFEDNNGIVEVDWNSLDTKDKLNIINSSIEDLEDGLDTSEIELINAIRESQLTPSEYLQHLQQISINNYLQNSQHQVYTVSQYSDDELFVMDLISRTSEITEEEALEALERAKSNETLFKKQIGAIRKEYEKAEEESLEYARLRQEQEQQDQFNQFAEKIEDSIINFKAFSGGQINMTEEDMQSLYEFITGFDNAGNSWFGKALQDPNSVVQMAWFLLNGEKMLQDITDYYEKEITSVRKESYNQGLADSGKKDTPTVTYKPKDKTKVTQFDDDLDDF